jgi:hypothetical protein
MNFLFLREEFHQGVSTLIFSVPMLPHLNMVGFHRKKDLFGFKISLILDVFSDSHTGGHRMKLCPYCTEEI